MTTDHGTYEFPLTEDCWNVYYYKTLQDLIIANNTNFMTCGIVMLYKPNDNWGQNHLTSCTQVFTFDETLLLTLIYIQNVFHLEQTRSDARIVSVRVTYILHAWVCIQKAGELRATTWKMSGLECWNSAETFRYDKARTCYGFLECPLKHTQSCPHQMSSNRGRNL